MTCRCVKCQLHAAVNRLEEILVHPYSREEMENDNRRWQKIQLNQQRKAVSLIEMIKMGKLPGRVLWPQPRMQPSGSMSIMMGAVMSGNGAVVEALLQLDEASPVP